MSVATLRPVRTSDDPPLTDRALEQAVLGTLIAYPDARAQAVDAGLHRDHFTGAARPHVWTSILNLHATGEAFDASILWHQHLAPLAAAGTLAGVDAAAIAEWIGDAVPPSSIASHVAFLADLHQRLQLATHLQSASLAVQAGDDPREQLAAAQQLLEHTAAGMTSTWQPVDLAAVITGDAPDTAPTLLHRNDGQALLYPGKIHFVNGAPEAGKGWLALAACREVLVSGGHVVYVDFEDGPASIVERLMDLHVDLDLVVGQFHYLRPDDPAGAAELAHLDHLLALHQPELAVLDGVTEAMAQNGWSIKDNDDVAAFINTLPRRIARAGPAVLLIDHVVKDREEAKGRYGIGGQHKMAGADVTYRLDAVRPFGRGLAGQSKLVVNKDRGGHVRPASLAGSYVADIVFTSTSLGIDVTIATPASERGPGGEPWDGPTDCMAACLDLFARILDPGTVMAKSKVAERLRDLGKSYRDDTIGKALERLAGDGRLVGKNGPRASRLFTLPAGPHLKLVPPVGLDFDPDAGPAGM